MTKAPSPHLPFSGNAQKQTTFFYGCLPLTVLTIVNVSQSQKFANSNAKCFITIIGGDRGVFITRISIIKCPELMAV